MTTKTITAGQVRTTKSRLGKVRSMPASAITSEERIAASDQVPAVEYETAAKAAFPTALDEQVADGVTPDEGGGSAEGRKSRARKVRTARVGSMSAEGPAAAEDEMPEAECAAPVEPFTIAPDAQLAAPAEMTEVGPSGTAEPARQSKKAKVLASLQRPEGVSVAELMAATGWQSHSVRALLTGFRKLGKELVRTKDEAGLTRYRLSAEG